MLREHVIPAASQKGIQDVSSLRQKPKPRHLANALVLLGAVSVGLGFAHTQINRLPTFITAPVEYGAIATLVNATGTVEAEVTVDVSSQLSGQVAEVFVNFNDVVEAGEPLAQLDPESFGITFGLYPAYRASRLDPIVALRCE